MPKIMGHHPVVSARCAPLNHRLRSIIPFGMNDTVNPFSSFHPTPSITA
jgi:hypothetical protein